MLQNKFANILLLDPHKDVDLAVGMLFAPILQMKKEAQISSATCPKSRSELITDPDFLIPSMLPTCPSQSLIGNSDKL